MLIRDEVRIERDIKGSAQEAYSDKVAKFVMEQAEGGILRGDSTLNLTPANPQRQLGRMLESPAKLEAVIKKYCPNMHVWQNGNKKAMDFIMPDGTALRACVYGAGPMPEWSVMNVKRSWIPDPDYALGKRTLERSEVRGTALSQQAAYDLIREKGIKGACDELLKRRNDEGLDDADYRPGFIKVLKPNSEAIRGWRTVIAYVLGKELITLTQAQEAVRILGGSSDRESWALRMGTRIEGNYDPSGFRTGI